MDHLLLHYDVASALWSTRFSRFRMSWVMSKHVIGFLACWWSFGRPMDAMVWKKGTYLLFLVLMEENEQ